MADNAIDAATTKAEGRQSSPMTSTPSSSPPPTPPLVSPKLDLISMLTNLLMMEVMVASSSASSLRMTTLQQEVAVMIETEPCAKDVHSYLAYGGFTAEAQGGAFSLFPPR